MAPKTVLVSKVESKGNKGAWLRLTEDEAARSREEVLYQFGCHMLDGMQVEIGSRFCKNEEVFFVVESLLKVDGLDNQLQLKSGM